LHIFFVPLEFSLEGIDSRQVKNICKIPRQMKKIKGGRGGAFGGIRTGHIPDTASHVLHEFTIQRGSPASPLFLSIAIMRRWRLIFCKCAELIIYTPPAKPISSLSRSVSFFSPVFPLSRQPPSPPPLAQWRPRAAAPGSSPSGTRRRLPYPERPAARPSSWPY
jgi:hypothetical protein